MVKIYTDIKPYKRPVYRGVLFAVSVVQVFLTSAPIFGYSSLLVIFKDLGLYQQNCDLDVNNTTSRNSTAEVIGCSKQDVALSLPFAFGIVMQSTVKIFVGYLVDCTGAKTCQYMGCIFLMMFGVSLAFVKQGMEYLIFLSFFFLSMSSSFLLLCPYQLVNVMFKKHKALFLSILSGSVDASTVIFIIFLDIYQKGFSLNVIVICYAVICTSIMMVVACVMFPTKEALLALVDDDVRSNLHPTHEVPIILYAEDFTASYMSSYSMYCDAIQRSLDEIDEAEYRESILSSLSHSLALQWSRSFNASISASVSKPADVASTKTYGTINEDEIGYGEDFHKGTTSYFINDDQDEKETLVGVEKKKPKLTPYAGLSLWQYVFSWLYALYVFVCALAMLKIVYFISTLEMYLLEMTDYDTATTYIKYFGYVQFCGVLVAPVCSLLFLQRPKEKFGVPLTAEEDFLEKVKVLILPSTVLIVAGLLLDGLQLLQILHLSIPIFILFLVYNSLLWCFISLFVAYLFPAKYYCTLLGITNGICGVVSFTQYPILLIEREVFNGKQFYTNLIFLILLTTTFVLPLYLFYFYKTYHHGNLEQGDEDEE